MPERPHHPLPPDAVSMELSSSEMHRMTELCAQQCIAHVEGLSTSPSWNLDGVQEAAERFREPPPEQRVDFEALLPDIEDAAGKSFTTAGPGYLAFIPGGGLFPSALAEYMTHAYNRYVGVWNPAPAFVQLELTVLDWIRQLVGYPEGANGLLTSGGSLSNLIALVTARRNRLPENFLDATIYA